MSGAETAQRRIVQRRIGGAEMSLPPDSSIITYIYIYIHIIIYIYYIITIRYIFVLRCGGEYPHEDVHVYFKYFLKYDKNISIRGKIVNNL